MKVATKIKAKRIRIIPGWVHIPGHGIIDTSEARTTKEFWEVIKSALNSSKRAKGNDE